jgi:cathepsin L
VIPEGPGKVSAGLSEKRVGGLPNEIDWRSLGKVTEVKEEGACGGSWAFASTAAAESYVAVYGGDLTDLSEEYVLECVSGGSCAGGSVAAALGLIANGGVPAESAYPYQAGNSGSISPKINGICVAGNKLTLPPGTTSTSSSNLTSIQLKSLISSSPIITLLDSTSDSGFLNYASGVYSCSSSPFTLNHAVELIGYDSSGNYLVKNSWGKTWGDNGFAVISQENNCGIGQKVYYFTGANEALKNVSYTFKLGNLTIEIYAGRMMVAVAGIMVTALTMMW